MFMAKKEKTTLQTRNFYKRWKYGLYAGTVAAPLIPATIHTSVMWNEWFAKTGGISLPFGFITLIMTVVASVIAILNSDTIIKKGTIALLCMGVIFCFVGITNLFLAKLFEMVGYLWIEAGSGLILSFTSYKIEQKVIEPRLAFYNQLVEDNALDKKSEKKKKAREFAEKEAREKAERERSLPTE